MNSNSNNSAKVVFVALALIAAGCSDTPKEPLVINDQPTYSNPYNTSNSQQSRNSYSKKLKNLFGHHNTVWERMLSLYSLPEVNNERIDREMSWYLSHPDYLARVQERAAPYMHLILDEIEAKNLPGELALLPVVESAFIPEAYSKSDASGLWQFIPSTGRFFGLQQNAWYDGRRDVYASTKAATNFLKDLGETFDGDWCLALASYNYGKGNIRKAIVRNEYQNLPTDYWSLDLPKETTDYVPRLLAIAKLFANADRYNVRLHNIPNKPYCEVVNVGSQLDLDKAAELAQTPLSHFMKLNPGFKKESTAPQGPHHMLIPVNRVQTFKKNLAQLPFDERVDERKYEAERLAEKVRQNELLAQQAREDEERNEKRRSKEIITASHSYSDNSTMQSYRVRVGENLTSIAKKHGTTVANIKQINHLSLARVNAGANLKVPSNRTSVIKQITSKTNKAKPANSHLYVVKKGDTFFNVSKRFAVSRTDIAAWNNISPNSNLKLGQKLVIRGGVQQFASASQTRLIRYTVKRGDTLMQLSRKFGVPVSELRKSNPSAGTKGLQPGQNLKILVDNNDRTT